MGAGVGRKPQACQREVGEERQPWAGQERQGKGSIHGLDKETVEGQQPRAGQRETGAGRWPWIGKVVAGEGKQT